MTNLFSLDAKCERIADAFKPSRKAMEDALFDVGIDPQGEAIPNDIEIIKVALILVGGFVTTSKSRGEVGWSRDVEAARINIRVWARRYGLDPNDYLDKNEQEQSEIIDKSYMW